MTTDQAVERQAAHECLTGDLMKALQLTDDNLSRLIAARHCDAVLMTPWRDHVRAVLTRAKE